MSTYHYNRYIVKSGLHCTLSLSAHWVSGLSARAHSILLPSPSCNLWVLLDSVGRMDCLRLMRSPPLSKLPWGRCACFAGLPDTRRALRICALLWQSTTPVASRLERKWARLLARTSGPWLRTSYLQRPFFYWIWSEDLDNFTIVMAATFRVTVIMKSEVRNCHTWILCCLSADTLSKFSRFGGRFSTSWQCWCGAARGYEHNFFAD